jgi:hypothetical protein
MASDLNNALKNATDRIVKYIDNIATLTVETRFVEVQGAQADFSDAKPAASTIIRMDGDCSAVVPLRKTETGALEVDNALFEMHQNNVATAIDYRTKMMAALLQTLKQSIS